MKTLLAVSWMHASRRIHASLPRPLPTHRIQMVKGTHELKVQTNQLQVSDGTCGL